MYFGRLLRSECNVNSRELRYGAKNKPMVTDAKPQLIGANPVPSRRRGAPLGNRNAWKDGAHAAAKEAQRQANAAYAERLFPGMKSVGGLEVPALRLW